MKSTLLLVWSIERDIMSIETLLDKDNGGCPADDSVDDECVCETSW
jgi:hypothetical protein